MTFYSFVKKEKISFSKAHIKGRLKERDLLKEGESYMVNFLKLTVLTIGLFSIFTQVHGSKGTFFEEDHAHEEIMSQAVSIYSPNAVGYYVADTVFINSASAGQMLLDNSYVRGLLAWGVNYCGLKTVEEAVSLTAYGIGTLAAGPVAGNSVYFASKSALSTARWFVPAFDIWFSGLFAPVTQLTLVAPAINYGPTTIKIAARASYGSMTSLYNWFWGS